MDDVTRVLTGQLPFVVLAGAIAAFPVSLGLLALYRRRVLGYMARGALPAGGAAARPSRDTPAAAAAVDCTLATLDASRMRRCWWAEMRVGMRAST